ncbi:DUF3465 domain-containing protein [Aurantivibrio infirmus]
MPKKKLLNIVYLIFVLALVVLVDRYSEELFFEGQKGLESQNELIKNAFDNKDSDVQVRGKGTVIRILPDDNEGSRHQRILLRLSPEQTLLIAHNIDLAPRINSLKEGDILEFYGEYEWNSQGGVVHWTHRDPRGRHVDGWLRYQGKMYQ